MPNPNLLIQNGGLVPLNAVEQDFVVLEVQSNNAAAIYPGYPVVAQTDGSVIRTAAGGGAGSTAICMEILQYRDAAVGRRRNARFLPASTTWTDHADRTLILAVLLHADSRFRVMADAAVASLAAARTSRWNNVNHVYGTEVAAYGIGNCKAAMSTLNTTDTLQWRIVDGLLDVAQNDPTQVNYSLIVVPNVAPVGLPPVFGGSATGV
jgi:hypothetical protein